LWLGERSRRVSQGWRFGGWRWNALGFLGGRRGGGYSWWLYRLLELFWDTLERLRGGLAFAGDLRWRLCTADRLRP
jgi:hypothetical protein